MNTFNVVLSSKDMIVKEVNKVQLKELKFVANVIKNVKLGDIVRFSSEFGYRYGKVNKYTFTNVTANESWTAKQDTLAGIFHYGAIRIEEK